MNVRAKLRHEPGAPYDLQPWLPVARRVFRWLEHPWRETPRLLRFYLLCVLAGLVLGFVFSL